MHNEGNMGNFGSFQADFSFLMALISLDFTSFDSICLAKQLTKFKTSFAKKSSLTSQDVAS